MPAEAGRVAGTNLFGTFDQLYHVNRVFHDNTRWLLAVVDGKGGEAFKG